MVVIFNFVLNNHWSGKYGDWISSLSGSSLKSHELILTDGASLQSLSYGVSNAFYTGLGLIIMILVSSIGSMMMQTGAQ